MAAPARSRGWIPVVLRCGIVAIATIAFFPWLLRWRFRSRSNDWRTERKIEAEFDSARVHHVAVLREVSSLLSRCKSRISDLLMQQHRLVCMPETRAFYAEYYLAFMKIVKSS